MSKVEVVIYVEKLKKTKKQRDEEKILRTLKLMQRRLK